MRPAAGFLLVLASAAAFAAPPEVTLEVSPATLSLPAGGGAKVMALLKNPGLGELRDVQLTTCSTSAASVLLPAPPVASLPAGGMHLWTLPVGIVSQKGLSAQRAADKRTWCAWGEAPAPLAGTVYLEVAYTWQEAGGKPAVRRFVLGSFAIAEQAPEAVEKLVAVEIKGTNRILDEHRPGVLYVVVTNKSHRRIEVTGLAPQQPSQGVSSSLGVTVRSADYPVTLRPQDARGFLVDVRPADAVLPGKHLVLLDLALRWQQEGRAVETVEALSHDVEVGVLGESALLTALGVPSFLLLPGFLMVTAFGLLGTLMSKAPPSESKRYGFLVKPSEPGFWVLAVSLSIVTAFAYPAVTGLFGWSRNYLLGYGLRDVVAVWMASILLAAVLFLLREVRVRLLTFAPAEGVLTVLRKLSRRGSSLYREQYDVAPATGANPERLFVLEDRTADEKELWVAPRAILTWTTEEDSPMRREIETLLTTDEKIPARLVRLLAGAEGKALTLEWVGTATVRGPHLREAAKLGGKWGRAPFVGPPDDAAESPLGSRAV